MYHVTRGDLLIRILTSVGMEYPIVGIQTIFSRQTEWLTFEAMQCAAYQGRGGQKAVAAVFHNFSFKVCFRIAP